VVFIGQIALLKERSNQKLAQHALQKQLHLLQLEEYLLLVAFAIAGVLGRTLLQGFPSIEPITFFAVLAGSLFGWKKGAVTGMAAWYASDYLVLGGQGPWSLIHILSGAVSGFLGGLFLKKENYIKALGVMLLSTLFFEIVMNISSGFFFGFGIIVSFLSAIPFMIAHLSSNAASSFLLPPIKKLVLEKGRMDEKEICEKLIAKIKREQHET